VIACNNTTTKDGGFPIPPGFVALRRFLGDVAPPSWSDDAWLVEIHNAEADEPEPVGCAYLVDDGSTVRVVAVLLPAVSRDYRVRMLETAIREMFPDRVVEQ
jgi:hypothetical protein